MSDRALKCLFLGSILFLFIIFGVAVSLRPTEKQRFQQKMDRYEKELKVLEERGFSRKEAILILDGPR